MLRSLFSLVVALFALPLSAADLEPTLGKKAELLLDESFASTDVEKNWKHAVGRVEVKDGALLIGELKRDEHVCAVRRTLSLQDAAVQFDVTLDGAKLFHFGYDPAPGELKKKGHLLAVVITPESWSLIEHNDKNDPQSKAKVHAKSAATFESGKTYTLLVECRGEKVVVSTMGREPLTASASDFAVKKPALIFRCGGPDGSTARIDNVKVWQLK